MQAGLFYAVLIIFKHENSDQHNFIDDGTWFM
jgi:hypothetical protein